jgi:hypothetical protein
MYGILKGLMSRDSKMRGETGPDEEYTCGLTIDGVFFEGNIISPPGRTLFTIKFEKVLSPISPPGRTLFMIKLEKGLSPIFALASGEVT